MKRSKRKRSARRHRPRLSLQRLEHRIPLAADFSIGFAHDYVPIQDEFFEETFAWESEFGSDDSMVTSVEQATNQVFFDPFATEEFFVLDSPLVEQFGLVDSFNMVDPFGVEVGFSDVLIMVDAFEGPVYVDLDETFLDDELSLELDETEVINVLSAAPFGSHADVPLEVAEVPNFESDFGVPLADVLNLVSEDAFAETGVAFATAGPQGEFVSLEIPVVEIPASPTFVLASDDSIAIAPLDTSQANSVEGLTQTRNDIERVEQIESGIEIVPASDSPAQKLDAAPPALISSVADSSRQALRSSPSLQHAERLQDSLALGRDNATGRLVPMTDGMRRLGLDMLRERSQSHSQIKFANQEPSRADISLLAPVETGSEAKGSQSPARLEVVSPSRNAFVIPPMPLPCSIDDEAELILGGPIARLHGFEIFDIFHDLIVTTSEIESAAELPVHHAAAFQLNHLSASSNLVIGVLTLGAGLYAMRNFSSDRYRRLQKQVHTVWGVATFLSFEDAFDETRPIVAKLNT